MMQKGFSLPEITVALGLVAGVSLVTMKLVENNARNQNTLKASSEIQKSVALLKAALNEPERCRSILLNQTVGIGAGEGNAISANPNPMVSAQGPGLFQEIRSGSGTAFKELLRPNTAYPGFRTANITLRKNAPTPADYAELVVNFANETDINKRNDGSQTEADKGTRIVIPLVVKLNASNQITDCQPSVSEVNEAAREKFCRSLGNLAVWDSTGTKTCKFRTHQCPSGQVPSVFQSTGALTCVPLSQQMKASDLFDAGSNCTISSGNFRIIEQGGKLRIDCN